MFQCVTEWCKYIPVPSRVLITIKLRESKTWQTAGLNADQNLKRRTEARNSFPGDQLDQMRCTYHAVSFFSWQNIQNGVE